jgi:hypothetical protein
MGYEFMHGISVYIWDIGIHTHGISVYTWDIHLTHMGYQLNGSKELRVKFQMALYTGEIVFVVYQTFTKYASLSMVFVVYQTFTKYASLSMVFVVYQTFTKYSSLSMVFISTFIIHVLSSMI